MGWGEKKRVCRLGGGDCMQIVQPAQADGGPRPEGQTLVAPGVHFPWAEEQVRHPMTPAFIAQAHAAPTPCRSWCQAAHTLGPGPGDLEGDLEGAREARHCPCQGGEPEDGR